MVQRIAVFIGQLIQEYQKETLDAMVDAAEGMGYRLDVFTEFGCYGNNYLHADGERNIINLPYIEDYVGVVVMPDTFAVRDMEKQLDILLLAKTKGPVVSIRKEKDCFYSVSIDNRAAMARVVEHFVQEHGFKRIAFMKGLADFKDASERFDGYMDVMNRYKLPVDEHMLFQGNYWRNLGAPAVDWFLSGDEMPEAIVCANDFMAISVLDELKKRGYRIPEDIAVSGFDDVEESRYAEPSLFTAHMPCAGMAQTAISLIDKVLKGEKSDQIIRLPLEICPRESCGCSNPSKGRWTELLYSQKLYLNQALVQNGFMNIDFENCDTIDELLTMSYGYSRNFYYKRLYICMCESEEDMEEGYILDHYTEHMVLRAVMTREGDLELANERFDRRSLLPDQYRDQEYSLYLFPLHHNNRCLGYMALETDNPDELKEFIQYWIIEISNCMDKILLYEENLSLQEFRRLSNVDELTGLYNRRKLEQELNKKLITTNRNKLAFYIISLDMDDLKKINDTYGHIEGDAALRAFADVLKKSAGEKNLACRVGGDEFTIVAYYNNEKKVKALLQRIEDGVRDYNETSGKPYQIAGSMGYADFKQGEELKNCIKRADINMYANKVARKKGRK